MKFIIEYMSCEGNFRWMDIEAEDEMEAESLAIDGSEVGGDGIAEILSIYEGEELDRDGRLAQ